MNKRMISALISITMLLGAMPYVNTAVAAEPEETPVFEVVTEEPDDTPVFSSVPEIPAEAEAEHEEQVPEPEIISTEEDTPIEVDENDAPANAPEEPASPSSEDPRTGMLESVFDLPAISVASELTEPLKGKCGENVTWVLDTDGTLTISGEGEMYYNSNNGWLYYKTNVRKVVIEYGVTEIGGYAFSDCSNISSVTIPDSVTKIEKGAFYNCSSLKNITIPDSVRLIELDVLKGCENLEEITLPFVGQSRTIFNPSTRERVFGYIFGYKTDTGTTQYYWRGMDSFDYDWERYAIPSSLKKVTVTDMPQISFGAFSGCENLTSITLEKGVVSIGSHTFYNCISLSSVTIPDSVTSIGESAFKNCISLTNVNIPNSVTSIEDSTFYGCSGMTSITIPNSVASIGTYAFSGCSGMTGVTIPNSVTSIGYYTFSDCCGLTDVAIPNSVTSIWASAFKNCISLTNMTIPDSVTRIDESAFSGCSGLENVVIGKGLTSTITRSIFSKCDNLKMVEIGSGAIDSPDSYSYGVFYNKKKLETVILGDGVTSIGKGAFSGCSSLTSVTIGNSVTTIDYAAFSGCSSLTDVTIPDSVTSIGGSAFDSCSSLTSITIPDNVTTIDYAAFSGCSSLTSVTIGNSVTSIGGSAFSGCSSLTSVTIGNSVTSIGGSAFDSCSSLTSITIPDNVTTINYDAFSGCSSLTDVTIPDSVTYIGRFAFSDCSSLTDVDIGNGLSGTIDSSIFKGCDNIEKLSISSGAIGTSAFENKKKLSSVYLGNGVTKIDSYAFSGCSSLTSIVIPSSVTSIGSYAFQDCTSLFWVSLTDSVTSIGNKAFEDCPITSVSFYGTKSEWAKISFTSIENVTFFAPTAVQSISISGENKVSIGKQIRLNASFSPFNATNKALTWSSSDTSVATVDSGYVTGKKPGTATITATSANGPSASHIIEVTEREPEEIQLAYNAEIEIGKTEQFSAVIYPSDADQTVIWESSDNSIASVDANGKVTGVSAGNATITAIARKNGLRYSVEVEVHPKEGVVIAGNGIVNTGKTRNLSAKVYPKTLQQGVTWSTANADIAEIDQNGTVTGKGDGYVHIYAVSKANDKITGTILLHVVNPYTQQVINAANGIQTALMDYINDVIIASKEKADRSKAIENIAKELMEKDNKSIDKHINIPAGTSQEIKDIVYNAYAKYLYDILQKKLNTNKINIDDDISKIDINLTKDILSAFSFVNESYVEDGHSVSISFTGYGKAGTGTITVDGKLFQVQSTADETREALKNVFDEMKKQVNDLMSEACDSLWSEFKNVTCIDQLETLISSDVRDVIEYDVKQLGKYGFGKKMMNTLKKFIDLKNLAKTTRSALTYSDATEDVLSKKISEIEKIKKQIEGLDYSDKSVTNFWVEKGMKGVDDATDLFKEALKNYLDPANQTDPTDYLSDKWKTSAIAKWGETIKKIIQCPVDFVVYDADDNILGSVIGESVEINSDRIIIEKRGDVKIIYTPKNMETRIELTGTASGSMNYVVEELDENGNSVGRNNYYDIPLEYGKTFVQENDTVSSDISSVSLRSGDEQILPNEYIAGEDDARITVEAVSGEHGAVTGGGEYVKGDNVELSAEGDGDHVFKNWSVNGEIVSYDAVYRFTAIEDVSVSANFEINYLFDSSFDVKNAGNNAEDMYAYTYKLSSGEKGFVIISFDEAAEDKTFYLTAYDKNGNITADKTRYSASADEYQRYIFAAAELNTAESFELTDASGSVIATAGRSQLSALSTGDYTGLVFVDSENTDGKTIITIEKADEDVDMSEVKAYAASYDDDGVLTDIHMIDPVINGDIYTYSYESGYTIMIWDKDQNPLINSVNL